MSQILLAFPFSLSLTLILLIHRNFSSGLRFPSRLQFLSVAYNSSAGVRICIENPFIHEYYSVCSPRRIAMHYSHTKSMASYMGRENVSYTLSTNIANIRQMANDDRIESQQSQMNEEEEER